MSEVQVLLGPVTVTMTCTVQAITVQAITVQAIAVQAIPVQAIPVQGHLRASHHRASHHRASHHRASHRRASHHRASHNHYDLQGVRHRMLPHLPHMVVTSMYTLTCVEHMRVYADVPATPCSPTIPNPVLPLKA
jgi:hypothetical protein